MVNVAEHFGANLCRIRKRAGLSQEQLSELASLHRTEIGMLERGIRLARVDTLIKLAGALEIDPADLLGGLGWKAPSPTYGRFESPDEGASL